MRVYDEQLTRVRVISGRHPPRPTGRAQAVCDDLPVFHKGQWLRVFSQTGGGYAPSPRTSCACALIISSVFESRSIPILLGDCIGESLIQIEEHREQII